MAQPAVKSTQIKFLLLFHFLTFWIEKGLQILVFLHGFTISQRCFSGLAITPSCPSPDPATYTEGSNAGTKWWRFVNTPMKVWDAHMECAKDDGTLGQMYTENDFKDFLAVLPAGKDTSSCMVKWQIFKITFFSRLHWESAHWPVYGKWRPFWRRMSGSRLYRGILLGG